MPPRRNPYHDPAIREGLNNLAGMFAPPSGTDLAGYATARARQQEAEQLAWLFGNPNDPTASARSALTGRQNYGQTPSGFAKTDATVRFTNAADNQRALQTNAADNQRAIAVKALDPLNQDQFRPGFESISRMYKIPELAQSTRGNISTAPGEIVTTPNNEVFKGADKPMSVDELNAQVAQGLMNSGAITPRQYFNTSRNVTTIVDEEGKIRSSTEAAINNPKALPPAPTGGARKDGMAVLLDGRRVPVTRAPDGLQWLTQDGTPIPSGAEVFDMGKPTGPFDQLGITNSNRTDANNLQAAVDGALFSARNMRKILAENPNVAGVPGRVKGVLQSLSSSAQQTFKAFANEAPDAKITIEEARGLLDRLERAAGGYDPNIVRLQSGLMDLAYARAQIANPRGEVSRQAFERALESFGQTLLSSQQDLETGLKAFEEDTIGAALVKIQSLRRGSGGQPGAPAPAGAPPPAAGGATTINTPAGAVTIQRVP